MTDTIPKQASAFRKGGLIVLKGEPCKILDMKTHKTGKHGHAKINFTGMGIFDGKKYEELQSATHNVPEPVCTKTDYDLVDLEDDKLAHLMDESGNNVTIPIPDDETGERLRNLFKDGKYVGVVVTRAMGRELISEVKELTTKD